jgi:hypothetical protein
MQSGWLSKTPAKGAVLILVTLQDLSGYGDNVVLATEAPVWATIEVDTMAEAMDIAIEYSEVFQVSFTTPDNGGTA